MTQSKITHIETANPALKSSQKKVLANIQKKNHFSGRELVFYKRFLTDQSIQSRYFGLETLDQAYSETPDEANKRFEQVGTQLGAEAVRKVLDTSGLDKTDIDGLIVTTCTGYLCPGLTSYVSEAVGMKDDLFTLDITGTGCGAAIPALRSADQYLQTHTNKNIIVLCVEVCSAAIAWGTEIDLILSNAIFGDGAAACLMTNKEEVSGYEIENFESLLWPQFRDDLRFKQKESRLCNVISKNVPKVASEAVKTLMDKVGNEEEPFQHYAIHPGGRRILDEIEARLSLAPEKLKHSREVLKEYGNMSSPSVLFVLKNIIAEDQPKENEPIVLFAFGAGFTAFAATAKYKVANKEPVECLSLRG